MHTDENPYALYIHEIHLLRNQVTTLTAERDALRDELEAERGHRKGLEKAYGNVSAAYELLKARGNE